MTPYESTLQQPDSAMGHEFPNGLVIVKGTERRAEVSDSLIFTDTNLVTENLALRTTTTGYKQTIFEGQPTVPRPHRTLLITAPGYTEH